MIDYDYNQLVYSKSAHAVERSLDEYIKEGWVVFNMFFIDPIDTYYITLMRPRNDQ